MKKKSGSAKLISIITSLAVSAALLAGCGGGGAPNQNLSSASSEKAAETSAVAATTAAQTTEAQTTAAQTTAAADAKGNEADWTVMVYLCGTDLESGQGCATYNLNEIAQTKANSSVNVVIQTGGTKEWKAKETLGLDIAADKLQRYHFDEKGFTLDKELPLAGMSEAATLTDFIKWSAEKYPAKKYQLVLWDHGAGSNGGLIVDQLYDSSIMQLDEFGRALKDSGVSFETVVIDACLMATLATAETIQPYAKYMIASEEVEDGYGSAYTSWLQYLYDNPSCSGDRFGRVFCDSFEQKYAELGSASASFMTFSVVDLSKINAVSDAFDKMFTEIGGLAQNIEKFRPFGEKTGRMQHYCLPQMIDIYDMASRSKGDSLSKETASAVMNAVDDAVVYSIKGNSRSYSHGLSFFYGPSEDSNTLDHYARVCKNAPYLAFLDEVNPKWTAPEWVYEKTKRLPEIKREEYFVQTKAELTDEGTPQLRFTNAGRATETVDCRLYRKNKQNGNWYSLGTSPFVTGVDQENMTVRAEFSGTWPSIGGMPVQTNILEETEKYTLFNIPFTARFSPESKQDLMLRAAYYNPASGSDAQTDSGHYEVFGVWGINGDFESTVETPSRDIMDLSSLAGVQADFYKTRTYIFTHADTAYYKDLSMDRETENSMELQPGMQISEEVLPAGEYYFVFCAKDIFGKEIDSNPIKVTWNGKNAVYSMPEAGEIEER